MTWTKLAPCYSCSTMYLEASMTLDTGFGSTYVVKDGTIVYYEPPNPLESRTVAHIEEMAKLDPDHDWRIVRRGPLHGETFQRHEEGKWVCVESNKGFA